MCVYFFSLRIPLPKIINPEVSASNQHLSSKTHVDNYARKLARTVLEASLMKLENMQKENPRLIRWELGSSWLQHLQKKDSSASGDSEKSAKKVEKDSSVKGLGKHFEQLRKLKKNVEGAKTEKEDSDSNCSPGMEESDNKAFDETSEAELRKLMPEDAFCRLKSLEAGLHQKVT
jgi:protein TIF31